MTVNEILGLFLDFYNWGKVRIETSFKVQTGCTVPTVYEYGQFKIYDFYIFLHRNSADSWWL